MEIKILKLITGEEVLGEVEIESEMRRTQAYTASIFSESIWVTVVPAFVDLANPSPAANSDWNEIARSSVPWFRSRDNIYFLTFL
jgi:hypothetical protein